MARNEIVTLSSGGGWTELTDSENATGVVTLQNRGRYEVRILATTDGTAPSASSEAGWVYQKNEADARSLADMYPGLSTPVRLWAWSDNGGSVMVSYA